MNIDDLVGVVVSGHKQMMVDQPRNNNSVLTSLLFTSYNDQPRHYKQGELIDERYIVFYSNVTAEQTARLAKETNFRE